MECSRLGRESVCPRARAVSELIAQLYATAQDSGGLPDLPSALRRETKADAAVFVQHDCRTGKARTAFTGIDAGELRSTRHTMPRSIRGCQGRPRPRRYLVE